jgi:hypothetical protein
MRIPRGETVILVLQAMRTKQIGPDRLARKGKKRPNK